MVINKTNYATQCSRKIHLAKRFQQERAVHTSGLPETNHRYHRLVVINTHQVLINVYVYNFTIVASCWAASGSGWGLCDVATLQHSTFMKTKSEDEHFESADICVFDTSATLK